MAQQTINIGAVANDNAGDPLRVAFNKANDNFTELYNDSRTILTAHKDVYVTKTGNDTTGDGTSGNPWLTIQRALDGAIRYDGANAYLYRINVGTGTYTENPSTNGPYAGGMPIAVVGGAGVTVSGNWYFWQTLIDIGGGLTLTAASGDVIYSDNGSWVTIGAFNAGAVFGAASSVAYHLWAAEGGTIWIASNYTISGGAAAHFYAYRGSRIVLSASHTVTLTGTPAFTQAFAVAYSSGSNITVGPSTTFTGSATGKRYDIGLNASLEANGQTLPGNAAGIIQQGGKADIDAGREQRLVNNSTGLTGSAIDVVSTDQLLNINVSSVSPTYALPLASGRAGVPISFKDVGGNFLLHPLTINRTAPDTIEGLTSMTLSNNYAGLTLVPANDGTTTGWYVL